MSNHPTITYGAHSDIGRVRKENQDTFGAIPDGDELSDWLGPRLFLVADGMGGHSKGGDASRIALQVIRETFLRAPNGPVPDLLAKAFLSANETIYQESRRWSPWGIMGSTCTALAISSDIAYVGHVGDSRAYSISQSEVRQMTADHSVVGELLRRGMLAKEEAPYHPERSQITRALGAKPQVQVDVSEAIVLGESETFLLCTDGLSNAVTETEMQKITLSLEAPEACKALVDLAVERGGEDNVTALVVHVQRGG